MELTLKQYNTIRLIIVFILAMFIGNMIVLKNYFLPLILIAVASILLFSLRKKVKGVLADERDYELGGKSALLAMQIYSWTAVVAMFVFLAFSDINPVYSAIAQTLSFSVCYFMLLYSAIFGYYNKKNFKDRKFILTALILTFFLAVYLIAGIYVFILK